MDQGWQKEKVGSLIETTAQIDNHLSKKMGYGISSGSSNLTFLKRKFYTRAEKVSEQEG